MLVKTLETRRIGIFLVVAFGFSWTLDLVVYLTGGLAESPQLVEGLPITLALVLIALSMWGPALGNIVARIATREGREGLLLRPLWRRSWPIWLLLWVLPAILSLAGAALYFALFPHHFDPKMTAMQAQLEALGSDAPDLPSGALIAVGLLQAIVLAPILNLVAVFGEEFGWRGYLQQKLMPLGRRRAMIVMGLIWGVWHWPVIMMGYNYGIDYPGYPILGPLAMVWFTFLVGTVFGWSVLRSGSVWPAVIGHGALNGIAGAAALFIAGQPNTILGPLPVGIIGGIGWAIAGLFLLWKLGSMHIADPSRSERVDEEPLLPNADDSSV